MKGDMRVIGVRVGEGGEGRCVRWDKAAFGGYKAVVGRPSHFVCVPCWHPSGAIIHPYFTVCTSTEELCNGAERPRP